MNDALPPPDAAKQRRARRTLILMALVGFAPVVLGTLVYFLFPQRAATNYGELLAVAPAPELVGRRLDGTSFRLAELNGRWLLVMLTGSACDETCRRELYATRQARTIQGREQDRVLRVWLVTDAGTPAAELLQEHPGLLVARVDGSALNKLPGGDKAIYLVDPRGNLVLQYPQDPDIRRLAKDLKRLLTASSIG
ncbi:MAG: hypothetical protein M3Z31_18955 [Pseudomonadota bacterium]|nr:hypothetical protein [Pseudomonadota bacterium]